MRPQVARHLNVAFPLYVCARAWQSLFQLGTAESEVIGRVHPHWPNGDAPVRVDPKRTLCIRRRWLTMTKKKVKVQVRRAYDTPEPDDGARVLVDRIWPRGLTKIKADFDEWCKEVAPSTELRKWYSHDPSRFTEFTRRYHAELKQPERSDALAHLRELAKGRTLTLLTATKRPEISEAQVLADMLRH